MEKKVSQKKEKKIREQDEKGNYNIDGVSYDGDNIIVGSEKIKEKQNSTHEKDEDSSLRK